MTHDAESVQSLVTSDIHGAQAVGFLTKNPVSTNKKTEEIVYILSYIRIEIWK